MNRSKYLLRFEISSWSIFCEKFKSLTNLIVLNTSISLKYEFIRCAYTIYYLPYLHPLQLKKALRYCKNPERLEFVDPKQLQYLFHLKSLTLHVNDGSSMEKASKSLRKLRFLQSLNVKYLSDYDDRDPHLPIKLHAKSFISDPDEKTGWGFFYKISKLPRLQRLTLQTSLKTLEGQDFAVQQDFADFYSRSHRFKIVTEVYGKKSLDIKELTAKNLASLFKLADSLSIHLGISKPAQKNPYTCQDTKGVLLSELENRSILKQGNRSLKLYNLYKEKLHVNIGCLLDKFENLASLYLKISGTEVSWDQNYEKFPQKLRFVVLDIDFLGLKYEILDDRRPAIYKLEEIYEVVVVGQRKVKFHSGLLELVKQLKTRAPGLETFILLICFANFKKSWYRPKDFQESFEKMMEEKGNECFEELESFEKFQRNDLCQKTGFLDESLNRALAAKSLKTVHTRSCCSHL